MKLVVLFENDFRMAMECVCRGRENSTADSAHRLHYERYTRLVWATKLLLMFGPLMPFIEREIERDREKMETELTRDYTPIRDAGHKTLFFSSSSLSPASIYIFEIPALLCDSHK